MRTTGLYHTARPDIACYEIASGSNYNH